MKIGFVLNGDRVEMEAAPNTSLFRMLRQNGVFGVKYGDDMGQSGADVVLLDGAPVVSSLVLAAQVEGRHVTTIEGVGGAQERGWRGSEPLHPLQTAFIETGAIQCGYCTPGMLLSAYSLLLKNADPDAHDIKEAISGNLCRCTGYIQIEEAIKNAAEVCKCNSQG